MLEEIEVPVALDDGVMNGMFSSDISDLEAAATFEVDLDLEDFLGLVEVNVSHKPGRHDAESSLKNLCAHASSSNSGGGGRIPTHFSTEAEICDGVEDVEFIGVQFVIYPVGSIVANAVFKFKDRNSYHDPDAIESINTALFVKSRSISKCVLKIYDCINHAKIVAPYKTVEKDILSRSAGSDTDVFCDEMDWRAWNMIHVVRWSSGDTASALHESVSMPWQNAQVYRKGSTFYWEMYDDSFIDPSCMHFLDIPNFTLTERSIYASASINLENAGRDFLCSTTKALASAKLRQYLVQVRLALSKCDLYQISAAAQNQDLFIWFEKNLSSFQHGKHKFEDLQSTISIAIESRDAQVLERAGRSVNAIFLIFTSIAFVGVVASILGFVDFENSLSLPWRIGALALAIFAAMAATIFGLVRLFGSRGD